MQCVMPICVPQPSPKIPLLIGGGGEQRTLALVARYADWWNFNSARLRNMTQIVHSQTAL